MALPLSEESRHIPLVPLLLAGLKGGRAGLFTQLQGLHGAEHLGRSGALPRSCHSLLLSFPTAAHPLKREISNPTSSTPPFPYSPSLIKIERTHVPISHLLEGCCGVYASSLYTGTKFEYHLHLPGRQWVLHQTQGHSPPPLPLTKHQGRQTR